MEQLSLKLAIDALVDGMEQETYADWVLKTIDAFNEKTPIIGAVEASEAGWNASVFSCIHGKKCAFYQKCLQRRCASEMEANILVNYKKNFAKINPEANKTLAFQPIALN